MHLTLYIDDCLDCAQHSAPPSRNLASVKQFAIEKRSSRSAFTRCQASPSRLLAWHATLVALVWDAYALCARDVDDSAHPNIVDFPQRVRVQRDILAPLH